MAKKDWVIEQFHSCSNILYYEGKFVARFKYIQTRAINDFKKFLIANFTPEEYFSREQKHEAPLVIMESKGYLLPHIRKMLKENNMLPTLENFHLYIRNQQALREATN